MYHRIIPRLDIKGPNIVKGIHLEGLRVLGKPEEFADYYYNNNADELLYVDVVASLYQRNSLSEIINRAAKKIFIPLTVAGGIRSMEDINTVLRCGADKVALNTAAIKNPDLVKKAAFEFGSSTITVAIETIRQQNNVYLAYTDNGREYTGIEVLTWAKRIEELGAGEILLTSIDKDGTGNGFDIDLIRQVTNEVTIPVIACGGAGTLEHIQQVFIKGKADSIALASILHYNTINRIKSHINQYDREGNINYLEQHKCKTFSLIQPTTVCTIKKYLFNHGIDCRV